MRAKFRQFQANEDKEYVTNIGILNRLKHVDSEMQISDESLYFKMKNKIK